mgnify:FL=1
MISIYLYSHCKKKKMRLKQYEIDAIQTTFKEVFKSGKIYLIGSRTDDDKKGGDIDLYIVPVQIDELALKKIDFLVKLKRAIGEQRIDVVIDRGGERFIDREAKQKGVILCQI